MSPFKVGRLCVKLAGRDAGKKCIIVERIDNNYVLVDGETRRKKANVKHLEPLAEEVDIPSGISRAEVKAVFKKLGIELIDTKPKQIAPRAKQQRKKKAARKAEAKKKK